MKRFPIRYSPFDVDGKPVEKDMVQIRVHNGMVWVCGDPSLTSKVEAVYMTFSGEHPPPEPGSQIGEPLCTVGYTKFYEWGVQWPDGMRAVFYEGQVQATSLTDPSKVPIVGIHYLGILNPTLYGPPFNRMTVGLAPTGELHIGTAFTFLPAFLGLTKHTDATLDVVIDDITFHRQCGRDNVPDLTRPDHAGCHPTMLAHTRDNVERLCAEYGAYFGLEADRSRIQYLSDYIAHPVFQDNLKYLFTTRQGQALVKNTLIGEGKGIATSASLLSPICPSCSHSSNVTPKIVIAENSVEARCYNHECSIGESNRTYSVQLTEPRAVNVFYLLSPLRDLVPDDCGNVVDLHLLGGDYQSLYGTPPIIKVARIAGLVEVLSKRSNESESNPHVPRFYVGPVLTVHGKKVSKSKGNNITVQQLREGFGDEWIPSLVSLWTRHYKGCSQSLNYFLDGQFAFSTPKTTERHPFGWDVLEIEEYPEFAQFAHAGHTKI